MSVHFDKKRNRWIFEFSKVIDGKRYRAAKTLPAGTSKAEAEQYSHQREKALFNIASGTAKERVKIETCVKLYIDHRCPELKTGLGTIQELALIYPYFKDRFLEELPDIAKEYAAKSGLMPATIRNRLGYLRAACKYAQKHHGLGKGISLDIVSPTPKNARQVYADRRQMIQISRACKAYECRALVRIAFYSGMRLGEIMSIGGKSSIKDGMFYLVDTKNGESRLVPIHPRLNVLLRYLPFQPSRSSLQQGIRQAMNSAGFEHMTLHDLRHSTASMMINNDVDLYTVGAILGHKSQASTKRYSHLATTTLAKAINKIR